MKNAYTVRISSLLYLAKGAEEFLRFRSVFRQSQRIFTSLCVVQYVCVDNDLEGTQSREEIAVCKKMKRSRKI